MAHPVPEELRVAVGGVVHGLEVVGGEVRQDRGPVDFEERPDDPASPGRDAGKAAGPRPLEDSHQHRLGLVVGGVAQRDAPGANPPRDTRKRRVANEPRGLLGGPAPAPWHLNADDLRRAAQAGGERLDERRIPVRLGPEAVVNVTDGELEPELGAEERERVEEGDRVGAARDAYEDVVSGAEEAPADCGLPDRVEHERRPPIPAAGRHRPSPAFHPGGGDSPWSPTQADPSSNSSRFQMGTIRLTVSIAY